MLLGCEQRLEAFPPVRLASCTCKAARTAPRTSDVAPVAAAPWSSTALKDEVSSLAESPALQLSLEGARRSVLRC